MPSHNLQNHIEKPVLYDRILAVTVALLLALGLVMVASSSIVISERQFHEPFYYFYRQLMFLIVGIGCAVVVFRLSIDVWKRLGVILLLVSLVFLVLVLVPGVGRSVNGSTRWLGVGGLGIQVSEFAKFSIVIFMAGFLVRRKEEVQSRISGFLKPLVLLGVFALLLLAEPDFGATSVIACTIMGMMFMAGVRLRNFVVLIGFVVSALSIIAISSPYRVLRLTTFLHPWVNPFGSGYQLTQSLIAFGRGGSTGVGLGQSIQKLYYLPEAHTDFLFAVLSEELGFMGGVFVMLLYIILMLRGFAIGRRAEEMGKPFMGYIAYGISLWLGIQFIVNMGVNMGMLPTKGLTLPLMSYGGSSLLIDCVAIAMLFRIDFETRIQQFGLRSFKPFRDRRTHDVH